MLIVNNSEGFDSMHLVSIKNRSEFLFCHLVFFIFLFLRPSVQAQSTLSIDIKSKKPDSAQLFYDLGYGFSEANSATVKLKGNSDFERVEFAIPEGNISSLRLDPLEKSGAVELRKVSLKSADKEILITPDQITPAIHIAVNKIQDSVLYIETTPDATDPQLLLKVLGADGQPLINHAQSNYTWLPYGLIFLISIILYLILKHKYARNIAYNSVNLISTKQAYFWLLLIIAYSFLFSYNFIRLANGDILNCYPFISPDGFDWYTEGIYLVNIIYGVDLPPLNVLRPPGFVCITALDYVAGENGIVIGTLLFIVLIGNYIVTRSIISTINPFSNSFSLNLILFVSFTFFPINYISVWLLADLYAMFFSLLSVIFIFKYFDSLILNKLSMSVAFGLIGSIFQTWALIPFLISCFCFSVYQLRNKKKNKLSCLYASLISVILHVIIIGSWRSFMPHNTTPSNFELLRLDITMLDFYINVWIFIFGPFLAYIFYSAFIQGRNNKIGVKLFIIICITLSFISLCFMYQWKESRFTYYFFPWFVILFVSIFRITNLIEKSFLITIVLLMCIIVPINYWQPQISTAKISPKNSWFSDYLNAVPINRNILNQSDNQFLKQADDYVKSSIHMYNLIKSRNKVKAVQ